MSKKVGLICAVVASAAVFCAMPISLKHSATSGVVVSVDQAKAYYGHSDASLDELTGATIIITTTIISTTDRWRDGSQPISFTAPAKFDCTAVSLRSAEITSHGKR